MEVHKDYLASLLKTLHVLEPYLSEIVICGGWVPLLYRRYGKLPWRHPLLLTKDIDVVVPRKLTEFGRPTIDELLRQAGYEVRVYGSEMAAVTKYELSVPMAEVEFLTPEVGRPGKASLTVQRGLTAQALRYLSILLENAKEIRVSEDLPRWGADLTVRVPSPAAFVYQKGLTLERRRSKVAKDLYYIFDVIDSSSELHDPILTELATLRKRYGIAWFKTFINNLDRNFPEDNGKGPILVASQYTGTMPETTFRRYVHHAFRGFIQALGELPSK